MPTCQVLVCKVPEQVVSDTECAHSESVLQSILVICCEWLCMCVSVLVLSSVQQVGWVL